MVIPIVKKMFPITSPSSGKLSRASLQSDLSVSLTHLLDKPIDDYLKKVNRSLKDLYEGLPDTIVSEEWSFRSSAPGTYTLTQKITIKQVAKQQSTILEALRFLTLGFLHSQGLLMKVALLCQTSEIDAAELEKLTKVKERLVVFSGLLDSILMAYYFIEDTINLPKVDDVKRMAKKLRKTIRNINPRNLPQLIPNSVVTEEDILCSFLGLHRDVADRLKSVNPVMRSHQSDLYFLQHFLADPVAYPEANESLTEREAVSLKLQEMGFTQSRSVVIANWIAKQPSAEHWSHLAWARHYIENLFTYDIFLNDDVCRYPYQKEKQNVWFSVPDERDEDGKPERGVVQAINITGHDRVSELIEEKKKQCDEDMPGQSLYFHGTCHKSAKSILEDGIRLEAGHEKCDFSDGKGFYLADDAWYAYEWAKKSKAPALLIFAISDQCLNERFKGLDLSPRNRKSDWTLVKNHFRKIGPKKLKENKSLKKELDKSDYIKGPISRDGTEENLLKNVQQICIRKEGMAKDIGSLANIFGVIFSNTN